MYYLQTPPVSSALRLLVPLQTEDLSRLYRLYCGITRGLEPIATIFRQVRTDGGTMSGRGWTGAVVPGPPNVGRVHVLLASAMVFPFAWSLLSLSWFLGTGILTTVVLLPYLLVPQHVTEQGTALVKQAEDAASNRKVCHPLATSGGGGMHSPVSSSVAMLDVCMQVFYLRSQQQGGVIHSVWQCSSCACLSALWLHCGCTVAAGREKDLVGTQEQVCVPCQ